jgi:hypothetical protein
LLLLGPNSRHAATIAAVLERHRHTPQIAAYVEDGLRQLARGDSRYDVVIVDMSRNAPSEWNILDQVLKTVAADSPKPMVLCLSDIYRGPAMQLEVERKGARLLWI